MVVSLGKLSGWLQYRNFAVTGFIPALLKEAVEWYIMLLFQRWNWSPLAHLAQAKKSKKKKKE